MRTGKLIDRRIAIALRTPKLDPDSEKNPDPKFVGALAGLASLFEKRALYLVDGSSKPLRR
jgi:hypothetical protein